LIVKFQTSIMDQCHHFLVKYSAQVLVKISMIRNTICSMLLAANIAVEQEVIGAAIMIAVLIFTHF